MRFRVHALMSAIATMTGVAELSPGVRSLQVCTASRFPCRYPPSLTPASFCQIRYDPDVIHPRALVSQLTRVEATLPLTGSVSSRVLHLPLAFEDSATLEAVARYSK